MSKLPYIHDEHLMAIGHVAIGAATLDHMIEFAIFDLMHPHHNSAEKILRGWNQDKQVGFVHTMLTDKYPSHVGDIDRFIVDLKDARKQRNDVIHYVWGHVDEKGAAKLGTYRPFRQVVEKSMTAAEIDAVADKLNDCGVKLRKLCDWLKQQGPQRASLNMLMPQPAPASSPWPLGPDQPKGLLAE
jgi:hypothetical protein